MAIAIVSASIWLQPISSLNGNTVFLTAVGLAWGLIPPCIFLLSLIQHTEYNFFNTSAFKELIKYLESVKGRTCYRTVPTKSCSSVRGLN